ncbi:Sorting and assembly machinery component 50 B [Liparis tanakae]|uniref:Sorting and assembly machinery component 50 B n=1 Tax=Liparis tanakae TaxID=230148 RepID=A0A4Z2FHS8_9TELE|nr:Sorting and assembly machinery component 50 B [Liparis tanakae]
MKAARERKGELLPASPTFPITLQFLLRAKGSGVKKTDAAIYSAANPDRRGFPERVFNMGTVHAKSLDPLPMHGRDLGVHPDDLVEPPEPEQESKQEILENKDVVVQHVNVQGLGRTKEDLLGYEISEVFHAKNLIDVMKKSHIARQRLLRLGIFKEVEVLIDTSEGSDALPNGLDVTFEVTEVKRLTGSYNTMVGNNEGSMVLGVKLPNTFGRAEKLTFQFSYGTKETLTLNMYKVTGQFPWSSLKETDRGGSAEFNFPLGRTNHTLKWEGVWRELGCLARSASFAVREESGHSLKSALSHTVSVDSRNSAIFPSRGALLRINQVSVCLLNQSGDYLGGEAYWAGGLHLYTPLPFRPGKGGFGDLFRTHFFLNAGNLCNLNYGDGPRAHLQKLAECMRWSYGAGIVLRLGNIARLELNYCVPMGVQSGDRICDGVQFGAGIRFL